MSKYVTELPSFDMGNGVAMVALGGVSHLPRMNDHTKKVALSGASHITTASTDPLDKSAIAVCKQMGISQEDFKKTLATDSSSQRLAALSSSQMEVCKKMGVDHNDYLKTLQGNN